MSAARTVAKRNARNTMILHTLQAFRTEARDDNPRLGYALTLAISELLKLREESIDADLAHYASFREIYPRERE